MFFNKTKHNSLDFIWIWTVSFHLRATLYVKPSDKETMNYDKVERILPRDNDNKVHDVPDVSEVGARVQHEAERQDLETFNFFFLPRLSSSH